MKKLNYKRISLLLLLTIVCIPLCACKKPETEEPSEQPNEQIQAPTRTPSTDKNEKNEMVYIILDKTGKKQKVIVNDRIINKQCLDEIKDLTNLDNLKLIKGNATFTKDLNNVTWNANKEDIYYTGETDKEIPVNISIKYYLNENEVTYEQLQGKSGKVTIRFDYTCNQSEIVKINNEDKTIYVPYLIISGVAFNNAKTANITSQNGKVIDDGKNSFVVGCAIPGLKEDLEIEDLNIPTYFEISMDAVDFNMDTTFSVATNQFMNGINSNDIKEEKQTLDEKITDLSTKLTMTLGGTQDLVDGTTDLLNGVTTLCSKINTLASSIGQLSSHSEELREGSKKVFMSLLQNVNDQFAQKSIPLDTLTIANYKTTLNNLLQNPTDEQKNVLVTMAITELDNKLTDVPNAYKTCFKVMMYDAIVENKMTKDEAITFATTKLKNAIIANTVSTNTEITPDATVYILLKSQGLDDTTAGLMAKICNYLAIQTGGNATDYIATSKTILEDAQIVKLAMADEKQTTKVNTLCLMLAKEEILPTVNEVVKSLDEYNDYYKGVIDYTSGVDQMDQEIKAGNLEDKLQELLDGSKKLNDGTIKLNTELQEFYENTLKDILEKYNNDFTNMVERICIINDVIAKYQMFTSVSRDMIGKTTYIYTTK